MGFIIRLAVNVIALLLLANVLPGFEVSGWGAAVIFALAMGIINAVIKPVVVLLTLPINFLTIGLFTLVINALLFWLASAIVFGVEVETVAAAFWGALAYSVVSWLASTLTDTE